MTPEEIKKLREDLGLTQERLAYELHISFYTVNRWERGKSSPKGIYLKVLQDLRAQTERKEPA